MKYFVKSSLSENMHKTPEGYLLCLGVPIARTGEMVYGEDEVPIDADETGKVLINREEKEVFDPKTIASFEGKPVTITHPEEFVSPENWKELTCGVMQNVRRGSGDLKDSLISDLLITDAIAIGLVENGLREVSCGYKADYTQVDEGHGLQTKIVGNHLALVEEGRAGHGYAIQDHKRKGDNKMTFADKMKSIFAKAQDDAEKLAKDEFPPKKDDDKEKSKDAGAYDELVQICKDLSEKVDAIGKGKDEEKPAPKKEDMLAKDKDEEEEPAKDEGEEASSVEERLKVVEAALQKIMESMSEGEESDDDMKEMGDEEEEESEDAEPSGAVVGDAASRAEILAPGLVVPKGKDVASRALRIAYETAEGKKIIDALNGGKKPTFDASPATNRLFVAASEMFKVTRSKEFSATKKTTDHGDSDKQVIVTAERQNEINAQFYKRN